MEALATLNNQRQFDFQNNGIEVMDLETLQRTYKENDIYGNPVRGIYHYQVIQRMTDICRRHNLNYEVEEIFAAQNKNRTQPGVVILPQVEQTYGGHFKSFFNYRSYQEPIVTTRYSYIYFT